MQTSITFPDSDHLCFQNTELKIAGEFLRAGQKVVVRDGSGVQMPPRKIFPSRHFALGHRGRTGPLHQHHVPMGFGLGAVGPGARFNRTILA